MAEKKSEAELSETLSELIRIRESLEANLNPKIMAGYLGTQMESIA